LEDDGVDKTKLFLKITGTTDKYTISYDKDAVKKLMIQCRLIKQSFRHY